MEEQLSDSLLWQSKRTQGGRFNLKTRQSGINVENDRSASLDNSTIRDFRVLYGINQFVLNIQCKMSGWATSFLEESVRRPCLFSLLRYGGYSYWKPMLLLAVSSKNSFSFLPCIFKAMNLVLSSFTVSSRVLTSETSNFRDEDGFCKKMGEKNFKGEKSWKVIFYKTWERFAVRGRNWRGLFGLWSCQPWPLTKLLSFLGDETD